MSTFSAVVASSGGGGHVVEVPAEVAAAFPGARPTVAAVVNGVPYRSRLAVYGGRSYLGLRLELLTALGATVGDSVQVELAEDRAPRLVEEPPELAGALAAEPAARAAYDALSYSHRREYATWVADAKRPDTRARRVAETIRRLLVSKD